MSTPNDSPAIRRHTWLTNRQHLILDVTLLLCVWGLAWTLRFEGLSWLTAWRSTATNHALISIPLWLAICAAFGLYARVWTTASVEELECLLVAMLAAAAANVVVGMFLLPLTGLTAHAPAALGAVIADHVQHGRAGAAAYCGATGALACRTRASPCTRQAGSSFLVPARPDVRRRAR
jgi:FlaA1/EpsC-like NDP-sugar epimerase